MEVANNVSLRSPRLKYFHFLSNFNSDSNVQSYQVTYLKELYIKTEFRIWLIIKTLDQLSLMFYCQRYHSNNANSSASSTSESKSYASFSTKKSCCEPCLINLCTIFVRSTNHYHHGTESFTLQNVINTCVKIT